MSRGERVIRGVMWGSGGVAAAAMLGCMFISNVLFPRADFSDYLDQLAENPPSTTYFHASDPGVIRAWKVCMFVVGAAVALLMLSALLYGFFYPPPAETAPPKGERAAAVTAARD